MKHAEINATIINFSFALGNPTIIYQAVYKTQTPYIQDRIYYALSTKAM